MNVAMVPQVVLPPEGLAADVAGVGPLVRVGPLVYQQVVGLGELSVTELANKLLLGYKEKLENTQFKRSGFVDRVKQEGALPRLKDNSKAITQLGEYKASNNWAPHRALHGQNDYIDILGKLKAYE